MVAAATARRLGLALAVASAVELFLVISRGFGLALLPGMSYVELVLFVFGPILLLSVATFVAWSRVPRPERRPVRWVGILAIAIAAVHVGLAVLLYFAVRMIADAL